MQYYSRFRAIPVFDETRPFFYYLTRPGKQPMQYCSSVEGHLSFTRPGCFLIPSLDQANNPCSTIQASVGHLSLMRSCRLSFTSLDLQSLSQAYIERGNKPL